MFTDLEVIRHLSKWVDFLGIQLDLAWGNLTEEEAEEQYSPFFNDEEFMRFIESWDRELRYMHHDYEEL